MRIAFFGGSFDPPHIGHLSIAEAAREALRLDYVLFAPVGLQPLKAAGASASFEDRVAMTRLAIEGYPAFEISLADAPDPVNPKPNYTIDTLIKLRACFDQKAEWFLLLGADSFQTLHHWHRAAEIPFAATLIVATRPGHSLNDQDIASLAKQLPKDVSLVAQEPTAASEPLLQYSLTNPCGQAAQLFVLCSLNHSVSATDLRRQMGDCIHDSSLSLTELLPPAVLAYIQDHHLYESH